MKRLRITGYLSFLVNGMLAVMTGTIITYLVSDYGISQAAAGRMVAAQSVGNLVMVLLSGFLINLLGRKRTLYIFPVLFFVGFGGVAIFSSEAVLYILFALTGLGWGLCNNILNIIMMEDSEGGGISVLYTSYAVGSFLGPFFVVAITTIGLSWKVAVGVVAVFAAALIPLFAGARVNGEAASEKKGKLSGSDFAFFKKPSYYVCLLMYFGYIGVEVGINSWIITYLVDTGLLPEKYAQTMFSVFWLIIIFVRLFVGKFMKKIKRETLLIFQWVGLSSCMSLLFFVAPGVTTVVLMVVMAIFMAAISPVNAENADEFIKGKGISGGIMFAVGCVGSTVLPMIVGNLADVSGIESGMRAILYVMYGMIIVCLINFAIKKYYVRH